METIARPIILVIDNDPMACSLLAYLADEAGFDAIGAVDKSDGLVALESRNDIQVVLLGCERLGSMSGLEFAGIIGLIWPTIGVLISCEDTHDTVRDLPEGRMFLHKPYNLKEIVTGMRCMAAFYRRRIGSI